MSILNKPIEIIPDPPSLKEPEPFPDEDPKKIRDL